LSELINFVWNQILIGPATNFIVVLDRLLFGSYGLAIIVFTIVLRLVTLPLQLRQMHSSKRMSSLQPRIQELQKKYSDPKRRSEETMKLYKEEGVNPAGCLLPTLIQFPIWIALYQVIRITLGTTPESLIDLSHRLYPWSFVQQAVPLTSHFLWLNLGAPDKTLVLPILVFATMWLQQKLTMTQQSMTASAQTAQTNQMMLWFMPLLFGYFSYTVPSGLAMYWVITNIAGIALNYFVFDWHGTHPLDIIGARNFKLSNLNPAALLAPPAKNGRAAPRQQTRQPAPQRGSRQSSAAKGPSLPPRRQRTPWPDRAAAEAADAEAASTDESAPSMPPLLGRSNGAAKARRANGTGLPSRNQPKAPPVARRTPPTTGRLNADGAAGNGEAETRSNDGRSS